MVRSRPIQGIGRSILVIGCSMRAKGRAIPDALGLHVSRSGRDRDLAGSQTAGSRSITGNAWRCMGNG
jgi:hypothetical protein